MRQQRRRREAGGVGGEGGWHTGLAMAKNMTAAAAAKATVEPVSQAAQVVAATDAND